MVKNTISDEEIKEQWHKEEKKQFELLGEDLDYQEVCEQAAIQLARQIEEKILAQFKEPEPTHLPQQLKGKTHLENVVELTRQIQHNHRWYISRGGLLPYDWWNYMGNQLNLLEKEVKHLAKEASP